MQKASSAWPLGRIRPPKSQTAQSNNGEPVSQAPLRATTARSTPALPASEAREKTQRKLYRNDRQASGPYMMPERSSHLTCTLAQIFPTLSHQRAALSADAPPTRELHLLWRQSRGLKPRARCRNPQSGRNNPTLACQPPALHPPAALLRSTIRAQTLLRRTSTAPALPHLRDTPFTQGYQQGPPTL